MKFENFEIKRIKTKTLIIVSHSFHFKTIHIYPNLMIVQNLCRDRTSMLA